MECMYSTVTAWCNEDGNDALFCGGAPSNQADPCADVPQDGKDQCYAGEECKHEADADVKNACIEAKIAEFSLDPCADTPDGDKNQCYAEHDCKDESDSTKGPCIQDRLADLDPCSSAPAEAKNQCYAAYECKDLDESE